MATGLVLEGGGVRGIYTAGVLDVFMDHSLTFDGLMGVSAGAIHGCSYLSDQKGRSLRYYRKYVSDPRFMSWLSFLKTGDFVGVEFCYHTLPDKLDLYDHDAFLRNPTPFYAVCTNVDTGQPEYLRITDMRGQIDILRASASLPFGSRIVEIGEKRYLDGGCSDPIPVDKFREMGYGRNVVILTRPADYEDRPVKMALLKLWYRNFPNFVRTLSRRHIIYNETMRRIEELERSGEIFVIRPSGILPLGRVERNPKKVVEVYQRGRADAMRALEDLRRWLDFPVIPGANKK